MEGSTKKKTHRRYFPTVDHLKQDLFTRINRFDGNPPSSRNALAVLRLTAILKGWNYNDAKPLLYALAAPVPAM